MESETEHTSTDPGKKTLLAIDDAFEIRDIIQRALVDSYHVMVCEDCVEAISLLERGISPDLILLDLMLPKMSGMDFLKMIKDRYPHLKTVVISAKGDVETVVEALNLGALDYIHKPFSIDELQIAVDKAMSHKKMAEELERLKRQEIFTEDYSIIYASSEMANIMETVSKVAQTDVPVLITGESGVGKEAIARELHQSSLRAEGPFLRVNCAALPASLLESELFGYNKGAFTGAVQSKQSKFESAAGGTLFLDEIGELAPPIQAKFLHVLQDGTFNRLGSNKTIQADARILVATNHDLEEQISKGFFRSDLYFRLNVVQIHIPPLRLRPIDISLLTKHFLDQYKKKYKSQIELDQASMDRLSQYHWPGNVRELQNILRRYVVLGALEFDGHRLQNGIQSYQSTSTINGDEGMDQRNYRSASVGDRPSQGIPPTDLHEEGPLEMDPGDIIGDDSVDKTVSLKEIARNASREAEKKAIYRALEITKWNKTQAAKLLQVSYKAFLYKMKDCDVVAKD
jgi:DNA-binding NtrC family response regulator